jgi:hypothetical protein
MAAVPVMITGVLWDDAEKSGKKVTIFGQASIYGLGVGGGPIMPQPPVDPGYGIPGPPYPVHPIVPPGGYPTPTPPIYYPPVYPIQPLPPQPGFPAHPIVPPGGYPPEGGPPGVPTFPIWGPPGVELPPGSGYPPVAGHPLPPPGEGEKPPEPIPNWAAQPVWTPTTGWTVVLVPTGDQPIPTPSGAQKK